MITTQPYSKLTYEALTAPYPEAQLPRRDIHQVIMAKCMLTLAITLQVPCRDNFLGLSEPQDTITRHLIIAARTWVTTNEEMHGTVESLLCIMLEGAFETNAGNLRRAWSVYRRAMTVAQLMGLHRSRTALLKHIDPKTDVQPEIVWFRIVLNERHLSMLLGLP